MPKKTKESGWFAKPKSPTPSMDSQRKKPQKAHKRKQKKGGWW